MTKKSVIETICCGSLFVGKGLIGFRLCFWRTLKPGGENSKFQDLRFRTGLSLDRTSLRFAGSAISENSFVGLRLGPDLAAHADAETSTETTAVAITPESPAKTQRFEKSEKNGANRELPGGGRSHWRTGLRLEFPANRELTGKFSESGPLRANLVQNSSAISVC